MRTITVHKDVFARLKNHAIAPFDDAAAIHNADGTVSFQVDEEVFARLASIDPDVEAAMLRLLGGAAQ